jgi:hypothetical protein
MMLNVWQILVSHSADYEDYYILGRDAVVITNLPEEGTYFIIRVQEYGLKK